MSNSEFLIWLQGYLEGQNINLSKEQVEKIKSKLPSKYQIDVSKLEIPDYPIFHVEDCELLEIPVSPTDASKAIPKENSISAITGIASPIMTNLISPNYEDDRFLYNPEGNRKCNTIIHQISC